MSCFRIQLCSESNNLQCASLEEIIEAEYGSSYDLNAILGVDEHASHADVVNAYTMLSIRNMPNPESDLTAEELLLIERKQNALKAAFTILSNKKHQFITGSPKKRRKHSPKRIRKKDPLNEVCAIEDMESSSFTSIAELKQKPVTSSTNHQKGFNCSQMDELWTSFLEVYCFIADCLQICARDETLSCTNSATSVASTPCLQPVPEHHEIAEMQL
mmetsp:Transcript_6540/g.9573  ORF Transcript_6540/g.9573 Transcript_6540/m.9573 type:complete len:216 (+) Transcript_6540:1-648(+)|eukprot:CAMPEP_0196813234 /NCGR_PEP_ID=MMETSP1362-20130617/34932_1 /TAXON_ID=163516 /ORGANISM="Leptocylindrus danicus, Strain CCMP1856" /LENGTH=215 /DNA_ID=CAMNT_0042189337 /DNA_START=96 /DNA_END=743 /DNA_ORIENTATION=-